MSGLALGDRLLTIAVTATITSAAWIVAGGGLISGLGDGLVTLRKTDPPVAAGAAAPTAAAPRHKPVTLALPAAKAGDFALPVVGVRPAQLADSFTDARGGGTRIHEAIDIMAPRGTPVIAAAAGVVERLYTSDDGGLTIYVRSPDRRTITYYAHLDAYTPGLAQGQQVQRGQQLGTVGATGNADPGAPHLHFAILRTTPQAEWWEPATAINPYPVLSAAR